MRKATEPMKESKERNTLPVDFMDPTLEMTLSSAKIIISHRAIPYFPHNFKNKMEAK